MTESILKCARCGNTHHVAQHNFTASGDRSPVCMHCDGGPTLTLPPDAFVPPVRRIGGLTRTLGRAWGAGLGAFFGRGGTAE